MILCYEYSDQDFSVSQTSPAESFGGSLMFLKHQTL